MAGVELASVGAGARCGSRARWRVPGLRSWCWCWWWQGRWVRGRWPADAELGAGRAWSVTGAVGLLVGSGVVLGGVRGRGLGRRWGGGSSGVAVGRGRGGGCRVGGRGGGGLRRWWPVTVRWWWVSTRWVSARGLTGRQPRGRVSGQPAPGRWVLCRGGCGGARCRAGGGRGGRFGRRRGGGGGDRDWAATVVAANAARVRGRRVRCIGCPRGIRSLGATRTMGSSGRRVRDVGGGR